MFDALGNRLSSLFDHLSKRGSIREDDIENTLRDIRLALLEADVALPVVQQFIEKTRIRCQETALIRSLNPSHQIIKIVHDILVETLTGSKGSDKDTDKAQDHNQKSSPNASDSLSQLTLSGPPPQVILLVGLQGSGKTTTTAKLGRLISKKRSMRVLMASLDTRRPAAQEQLTILGQKADVPTLPVIANQTPTQIAKRALQAARLNGSDIVLLDTAGRLQIDENLMQELQEIEKISQPVETLLVADALTGQDAIKIAEGFTKKLTLTGIALTRIDGDSRGGAALSMRESTGRPIKFLLSGENRFVKFAISVLVFKQGFRQTEINAISPHAIAD
ncbi:MAG: signal recognition particle receptor subunit alpha, partial [Pseudomonadota bacterium]